MGWVYLSETRDTWAIENESPSPDKEKAFLQAMTQLRERPELSEAYLVMLHDAFIANLLHIEAGFRTIQWIRQNNGRLPYRRRNAPELQLLQPGQLERIEAVVADCFFEDGPRGNA